MKNYFKDWTLFEGLLLAISTVLIVVASWIWQSPWYGYVASITGIFCVVLVAKGRVSNYYWGIVNILFYAYTAYTWMLYGEVMLNIVYFLPMQFYGLWVWTRKDNVQEKGKVTVKLLSNIARVNWVLISIMLIVIYWKVLEAMGGNLTLIDSMSTVLSVVAMFLMARRYMEQWILWIIVDVVSVIMWFIVVFKQGGNDIGILIMWTAYLINAVYGFYNWVKMYKE